MALSKIEKLRRLCEKAGFTFDSYNPGGTVRLYRFFDGPARRDYFESKSVYVAKGWKEARGYALGRIAGVAQEQGEGTEVELLELPELDDAPDAMLDAEFEGRFENDLGGEA